MKYVVVLTTGEIIIMKFYERIENTLFLKTVDKEEYFVKYGRGKIQHIVDKNVYEIENYGREYLICECGKEVDLQRDEYFECYMDEYDYCSLHCCIEQLIEDECIFVNESGEYLFNNKIYKDEEDLISIIGDYK